MKFSPLKKNGVLKAICGAVLIFSFILTPVSHNFETHQFETNTADAFFGDWWLVFKEQVLDMIVWEIINLVLEQITLAMTDWVKGGFHGSPAFVTDLNGFLLTTADQATVLFINGTPLEALCSPFKFQIQSALLLEYGAATRYKAECTLSDIVDNMDAFLDGNFFAGGWSGWAAMTQVQENNVYGATLSARGGLNASIANSTGEQLRFLDFGSGFFGQEKCEGEGEDKKCGRVTPGDTINTSLNNALNNGNGRLRVADEINELFGALLSQLVQKVLSSDNGLSDFKGQTAGPVPTVEEARERNDDAIEAGKEDAVEAEEAGQILADAADYCRENYDRPLSDELWELGYSFSPLGNPITLQELRSAVNTFTANECLE